MKQDHSKILIVDDNTFYLSVIKTIMKDLDAEVFMASSGNEALEIFAQNDFALAILDIEMPDMNGFELADRIRKHKGRDLLPVIFLTAYMAGDSQMYEGYDKGAIDYLTKPVNKNIFISKVNVFLELDRQKRKLIAAKESVQQAKLELEVKQKKILLQNEALKKAQAETEESRKKYLKLYDFAPTGYFTVNGESEILEINLRGAALLGDTAEKFKGFHFRSIISADTLNEYQNFIAQVFKKKSQSGCEIKINSLSGKILYVYLEGSLTDDGENTCMVSMSDITDRKEAQKALKESEELYHSLLKTSPDGIIITDLGGRITEASNIAAELTGNHEKTLEGLNLGDFIPKSSRRDLIKICGNTQADGMIQNFEIKLNRFDKSEFFGEVSSSQIKGPNGEPKAFMSVIRDISERKVIEKQLRHSERMAGIGELATGMAHEINQPLNTISLAIDNIIFALDANTLSENYLRTKLDKVFDNITRMKKIIDHVRTFSRDQDDFVHTDFDINTSIQNGISMISEQFQQKEINLNFLPDEKLPAILGNAYRFEQVVVNMLINAKDAIEEKNREMAKPCQKQIDISTALVNNQIMVEISDNGIGIKPEDLDRVLLPFYTTKAPGQGTGLGLSISYGIIKELGGEIDIQSKPMTGTKIILKIPVRELKYKYKKQ